MTRLHAALWHAARGFHIFPVNEPGTTDQQVTDPQPPKEPVSITSKAGKNFYRASSHPQRDAKGRYKPAFRAKVAKFVDRELKSGRAANLNQALVAAAKEFDLPNREGARNWYQTFKAAQVRAEIAKESQQAHAAAEAQVQPQPKAVEPTTPPPADIRSLSQMVAEYEEIHDAITGHEVQIDDLRMRRETLKSQIAERIWEK